MAKKTYVNLEANTQYNETLGEINTKISALKNALRNHKRRQMNNPVDWGFVGTIGYVNEKLEELLKSLLDN